MMASCAIQELFAMETTYLRLIDWSHFVNLQANPKTTLRLFIAKLTSFGEANNANQHSN